MRRVGESKRMLKNMKVETPNVPIVLKKEHNVPGD